MNEDDIRILVKENKIMTLKELFNEDAKARKELASMTFEEKIKALIILQEIAHSWGGKKDVIIWQG